MLDISWSKLLVIAVVALIFIGPKELPDLLHTLGRMLAKMRRSADDFRRQFEDSMKDTGYQDLKANLQDFRQLHPVNQLKKSIETALATEPAVHPTVHEPNGQSATDPGPTPETKVEEKIVSQEAAVVPVSLQHLNGATPKPSEPTPGAPV